MVHAERKANDALWRTVVGIAPNLRQARVAQNIITTIAFIAVALATVGLYAVTAYGVARRTREIGIRVALGSQPRRTLWLVARGTLVQVSIGLVAGLVLKQVWGRMFGGLGLDWANLLGIVVVLAGVAGVASIAPAARALRVDPISALRSE